MDSNYYKKYKKYKNNYNYLKYGGDRYTTLCKNSKGGEYGDNEKSVCYYYKDDIVNNCRHFKSTDMKLCIDNQVGRLVKKTEKLNTAKKWFSQVNGLKDYGFKTTDDFIEILYKKRDNLQYADKLLELNQMLESKGLTKEQCLLVSLNNNYDINRLYKCVQNYDLLKSNRFVKDNILNILNYLEDQDSIDKLIEGCNLLKTEGFNRNDCMKILHSYRYHCDYLYRVLDNYKGLYFYGFSKKNCVEVLRDNRYKLYDSLSNLLNINIDDSSVYFDDDKQIKKTIKKTGFNIEKEITRGANGIVYKATSTDGTEWTIKINIDALDFRKYPEFIDNTIREMGYYYLFNKNKIGPVLPKTNSFFIDYNSGHTAICTKLYTGDLMTLLKNLQKKYYNTKMLNDEISEIENLLNHNIDKMLDMGVICIDMKPPNVLADWDTNSLKIKDLVLTDFGIDWCCNSNVKDLCKYLKDDNTYLNGDRKKFMKYLILFSFAVSTYSSNIKLFYNEMVEFRNTVLYSDDFIQFLNYVCDSTQKCSNLSPPFFYLRHYKIIEKQEDIRKTDLQLKKKNYNLYLIKTFLDVFC